MTFTPASIQIPEELLADMLAETQVWRGMVAYSSADWDTLKTIVASGGIAEGDALLRIEHVYFDETIESNPPRPRCVIRQFEEEIATRNGGFLLNGSILAVFELPVPASLAGREGAAIKDARTKLFALKAELLSLAAVAGRMRITSLSMDATGINDPEEDGFGEADRFLVGVFTVSYDGGAC